MIQDKVPDFTELFEEVAKIISSKSDGQRPSLKYIFEELLNHIMLQERNTFLQEKGQRLLSALPRPLLR